jgi:hypothetical protein
MLATRRGERAAARGANHRCKRSRITARSAPYQDIDRGAQAVLALKAGSGSPRLSAGAYPRDAFNSESLRFYGAPHVALLFTASQAARRACSASMPTPSAPSSASKIENCCWASTLGTRTNQLRRTPSGCPARAFTRPPDSTPERSTGTRPGPGYPARPRRRRRVRTQHIPRHETQRHQRNPTPRGYRATAPRQPSIRRHPRTGGIKDAARSRGWLLATPPERMPNPA